MSALETLLEAVQEMARNDDDAETNDRITWTALVKAIAYYVGLILKRDAHDEVVRDIKSKLSVPVNGEQGDSAAASGSSFQSSGVLATRRAMRLSRTIADLSSRLRVRYVFHCIL